MQQDKETQKNYYWKISLKLRNKIVKYFGFNLHVVSLNIDKGKTISSGSFNQF